MRQKSSKNTGQTSIDFGTFETSTSEPNDQTSSAEASLAKISAAQEKRLAWLGNHPPFGGSLLESFASFDLCSSSWRTSQVSLTGEWEMYSESWPRSGTMQNGIASRRQPSALRIKETGHLSWPTPMSRWGTSGMGTDSVKMMREQVDRGFLSYRDAITMTHGSIHRVGRTKMPTPSARWGTSGAANSGDAAIIRKAVDSGSMKYEESLAITCGAVHHKKLPEWRTGQLEEWIAKHGRSFSGRTHGSLNPMWVEWLMGFPPGWTDLDASETPSCHKSRKSSDEES